MILIGNLLDQFGSNDSFHTKFITGHFAQFIILSDDVIKIHQTSLVTINQYPFAFIVLTSDTYAVGIRVGSHYKVGINFFSQIKSHRQSFCILRIRRDNCREVTVLNHLLGHGIYVLESPHLQCTRNQHHACTVDRSVYNLHIFMAGDRFRIDRNSLHHIQIYLIDIFSDDLNQIRVTLELDIGSRSNLIHFIDNALIVRSQYLRTVVPISLITVVFFRVV